jgi:hypothetical protein
MAPSRSAASAPPSPAAGSAAPPAGTASAATNETAATTGRSRRKRRPAASANPSGNGIGSASLASHRAERSDVLVSAVISTYLLTHLHHVLQRAEYGAQQEGHPALAANYAQLRKVLCLDARTMEDACAHGTPEEGEAMRAA